MILKKIDQNNEKEFLNFRINGVGASDAPIILNKSPYKKRHEILKEKITGETQPFSSFLRKKGEAIEKKARAFIELTYNKFFQPITAIHDEYSHIFASLDGLSSDNEIFEAKYVGVEVFNKVNSQNDVKCHLEHYYIQIQYQLFVVDNANINYLVLVDSKYNKKIIPINFDDDYFKKMDIVNAVNAFWSEVLKSRDVIIPTIKTMESEKKLIEVDDENLEALLAKREKLHKELKEKEKELKNLEDNIKANDIFKKMKSFKCGTYSVLCVERLGAINYKKIPQLNGVNLDQYRNKSIFYYKF